MNDTLRTFLQRAEVRLSTIHRIAGAFISGAGLLIMFPFLFKDAFPLVIKDIISNYPSFNS